MRRLPPRATRTDTLFPYTTLFRSSRGVTVVAALLSLSAASAAQAPAGEPVPKLNDRHPFLGPDARTSEYPVRIPMKPVAETGPEFAIRGGQIGRAHV